MPVNEKVRKATDVHQNSFGSNTDVTVIVGPKMLELSSCFDKDTIKTKPEMTHNTNINNNENTM